MIRGAAYGALNHRQRLFVDGIMSGKTQTQAAIDAGYAKKSATVKGSTLLRNANVAAALREVRGPDVMAVDEIQRLLSAAARGRFQGLPGDPVPPFEPMGGQVECPSCGSGVPVPLEAKDRIRAVEILAKTRGMFTVNVKHAGEVTVRSEFYQDTTKWPLELAEEHLALLKRFADEEREILARVRTAMEE